MMLNFTKMSAVGLAMLSCAGNCLGQTKVTLEVLLDRTRALRAQLCENVRVVGSAREFNTDPMGQYTGTCSFTLVAGDRVGVYKAVERAKPTDQGSTFGFYRSGDYMCQISSDKASGSNRAKWAVTPWDSETEANTYMASDMYMHVGYAIENAGLALAHSGNAYYADIYERTPESLAVTAGSLRGKRCVVVTGKTRMGGVMADMISYLDPVHYCLLEKEISHKFDYAAKKPVPVRQVTKIDYAPALGTAAPFPSRIRTYYVEPDGTQHDRLDVTYSTYEKYTPAPDELDFRTQFGIEPPRISPRPPLPPAGQYLAKSSAQGSRPGWSTWWLFAAAGVVAIAAAAIVITLRRRRA